MFHAFHAEGFFDSLNGGLIARKENAIYVGHDGLDINGTVLRHVFANGFEVLPEVPNLLHQQPFRERMRSFGVQDGLHNTR